MVTAARPGQPLIRRMSHEPPNNAMKLTRGGLVAGRSIVGGSCYGVAATKRHGEVVRPSQLMASVGRAIGGNAEGADR